MENIRKIAVVAGGWSGEREISLASGRSIVDALKEAEKYEVCFIDVKKDLWLFAQDIKAANPDVIIVATHGVGGEDGVLQGALEMTGIPYTHSGVLASALAMDKVLSRVVFEKANIQTPKWLVISKEELLKDSAPFQFPFVIKPIHEGSSLGVFIIHSQDELEKALSGWNYGQILVEEYIKGREIQCAVFDGKAMGVIEIKPRDEFFDYKSKYTKGEAEHIMPAPILARDYQKVLDISEQAYQSLGCNGVARLDFIYDKNAQIYLLELNNLPGMTTVSLVPEIARYNGISYLQLLYNMIESAVKAKLIMRNTL